MFLPFVAGDIILTQEVNRLTLGCINSRCVNRLRIYGLDDEPTESAVKAALSAGEAERGKTVSVRDLFPDGVPHDSGTYTLDKEVYISTSYLMAWYVNDIDNKEEKLSLAAIGQNREARKKDFLTYLEKYGQKSVPSIKKYMTADVRFSFLAGKAVYVLGGEDTIIYP